MLETHGIRFDRTRFWVIHRRREYGPFDYEWIDDLSGMELHYKGIKFGEICSYEELFADMREFRLPMKVVHVACVVIGTSAIGIARGYNSHERQEFLEKMLHEFNCHRFVPPDHKPE
ncbi:hypothetical protein [Planctomicrobium sp. SH527]|uniref:hypothetical protein n=1 Tax=Planctomicrobium sp. SH527 TaxID=3448123 RepID=UPI003F5BF7C0